jgi:hypothetical protein
VTTDLPTRCRCGNVEGTAVGLSPRTTNRFLCYCRDCRAYLRWLGRTELVHAAGGVDIVQLARSGARFSKGEDALRCVRLSPKGMHRWFTECCRTPVGNTMLGVPFIGLSGAFLASDSAAVLIETCGEPVPINERSATAEIPGGVSRLRQARAIAHAARLFASWMITERGKPGPLFDATETPRVTPRVLTPSEREAIRDPA